ncbi:MAG: ATP-binding protein, partial [Lentisphaeria bacterium]
HHGCLDEVDQWIYKEDLPNAMQKWKHLLEKRKDSEKLYYRVQDGKDFLYYSACLYVEYDENMNLYVNGIIQNITKFYLHFQNYNDQTKFNDMVIDTIPCDFFIKNADDSFRYVACNQSFAEYLELEIHDVIGKTDAEIFSNSKDISEFAVKDQHILNFDGAETFEQTVTDNNKLKRVFLIVKKLFVDQSRRHLLVGIRSEITNQKHVLEAEKIKNKLLCAVGEDTTIVAKFTSISKILMEKLLTDRILLTKCRKDGMLRFEDEWLTSGINSICNIDIEKFYDIWDNRMAEIYSNIVFSDENISKNKWYAELNKNKDFRAQNIMVVPIFAKEKLWGCYFLFFLHQLHEYKDVEQQIMSFCADIVSTMVVKEEQQKILNQKKEQQQLILSTIDIPICLYDGERNLLRANSATCNLLNVPQERMTANLNNKLFAEFFRPEKFQPLNGMIAKESKAEKNINYNGRDYKMITEPVFNNMGHLIYIVKAAIDVTANNKFIARQSAIRQALVILLRGNETKDALGYAMRVLGFNLNVSRVAMFKYSGGVEKRVSCYVEEAINGGKKIFENVKEKPFDDKSDWYERFRYQTTIFLRDTKNISSSFYDKYWFDLIEKTNIRSMYATRVLVNSSLWGYICVTFEGTPHPLNDEEIRLLETFAHFFEVFFEREIISKKLEDALDAAKEVNKTKSFFFASVSHEIRTPLNAILGFTELLVNSTFDRNTTKDYLNSINYAGKSLMQLINDVLDLSKLESDRMIINPVDTDLSGLCKDVVSVFKYSSEKNNIELSSDIPKMPYLLIDPSRIRQILFNLLSNAMKFTKKGSVKLVVKYTQNSKETIDLELAVIDTGIGISAEDCKRIMEPYVQVNRMQETSGNKGSGLGLSITKRIVEKMGGNFIIKSVPEKGSKFIV